VPISIETVPPDAPPDDDAAALEELADVELDDDELPQAPIASAAMTVSSDTEAGLVCLFTDPPPQEVGFPEATIYSLIASDASRFRSRAGRLINPQHSGPQ